MTLNFLSDIKLAIKCNGFSGTRESNVVRVIDELKNTYGYSFNSPFLEIGKIFIENKQYKEIIDV